MDKKVLKERLNEVVESIKANSKDAGLADKLVGDLLSVKGQLDVEPLELNCGKKIDEFKGETFRVTLTDRGVLYHEYGGYSVFTTPNNKSIYNTLADMVENKEENANAVGEAKTNIELAMSAVGYCLALPRIAFIDADFTFEIATRVIDFIKKQYDELMGEELKKETIEEDAQFRASVLDMEELKKAALEDKK